MKFKMEIDLDGEEFKPGGWEYGREIALTRAIRSVAHEIGSSTEHLIAGPVRDSQGLIVGGWKIE